MRISGPISVQRARPAPGWTGYGSRMAGLPEACITLHPALTLPPQQRGDAACLTLVMAQTYGGATLRAGAYAALPQDNDPLFSLSA